MFTTRALLCFALLTFAVTVPARTKHVSKASTHKILDIIHRLLNVAGHNSHHHRGGFVAFDVALTRSFTAKNTNDVVLYNLINLNIGKAFHTGVFTCPIDGVYEFTWTSLSDPGKDAYTGLLVNGSSRRLNYNKERTGKEHSLSTSSLITHLKKGDRVWIILGKNNTLYGNMNQHTSFQGKILHADQLL